MNSTRVNSNRSSVIILRFSIKCFEFYALGIVNILAITIKK